MYPLITFILSSLYVLTLNHFASDPRALQKSLVIPIIILLFLSYRSLLTSWKGFNSRYNKYLFIFLINIAVQLLTISTGGLQSPFFILIHLCMICLSFVEGFAAACIFLLSSFVVILTYTSYNQDLVTLFYNNPLQISLQLISFISIIPMCYLVARQYRSKDALFGKLRIETAADKEILENIQELILVTNPNLQILSVNDAVETALQRSRSELINKPLFDVLLLKDKNQRLVTQKTFFTRGVNNFDNKIDSDTFFLINSGHIQKRFSIQVHFVKDSNGKMSLISFILSTTEKSAYADEVLSKIEKTRVHYEAMVRNIHTQLGEQKNWPLLIKMLILENTENDIYQAQLLKNSSVKNSLSRIDVAQLLKHTVGGKQNFARELGVKLEFEIKNFGKKDIEPLAGKNSGINPEKFTGPFFTAVTDVKQLGLAVRKLLDLAVFLSAGNPNASVLATIDRACENELIIRVNGSCPGIKQEEASDLLLPDYGSLSNTESLHIGSGLEGFLLKTAVDKLQIPLSINCEKTSSSFITFTLRIQNVPKSI